MKSDLTNHQDSLGIIGYGDFGKILYKYLRPYFRILIHSSKKLSPKLPQCDLEQVIGAKFVIVAIPAQYYEQFFSLHGSKFRSPTTVIDVASIKLKPISDMLKLLPSDIQILATHPMFGPQSIAKNGLAGQRIMMNNVRIKNVDYNRIKNFLIQNFQLKIIETSPQKHDLAMAYVQGLSHYIGRLMDIMAIPESQLTTQAYEDLIDMRRIQGQDSWDLFKSIMQTNPYTADVNLKFKKAIKELDRRLEQS